jgi:phosphate transport system substrate-binding protein
MFKFKNVFMIIALVALAVIIAACASEPPAPTSAPKVQTVVVEKVITPTPGPAAPKAGSVAITGAGATFPNPLYSRWFYDYAFVDTAAKINYQAIGSGGGISAITSKTVDFGASDALLNDDQYKAAPGIQMLPTVAGAIVPVYNLKDTDGKVITDTIKFPSTAIADIYLGKIKTWDDPVLKNANPNIKLPSKSIGIVRRSDGSGTTFAFTDYLSQVSPEWKSQVGSANSVKWPVEGIGGKGNEGVTAMVGLNDGTIGYVEYAYAKQNGLTYGSVQNKAGNYVTATPAAVQADMADFGTNMGDKLALSIANGAGKDSWPISTYTYLLIYMDQADCAKGKKILDFVKWALTDPAAQATAKSLDYVTLPDAVRDQVLAKIGKVTCQGKPF